MAKRVEVIVGTYEEYVLGYKVGYSSKNGKETLSQSFASRSHAGFIRCLAASGKYLASGAADDRVIIYDMQSRKEIQILMQHDGSVNSLSFTPDATHLLSGGEDGKLVAVRTNSWQIEAVWQKAHSGSAVTCISCHPSGKLALSLGNDLTLRTWNLIKGRLAYTTNLKNNDSLGKMANGVSWSPDGKFFTLIGARVIEIWRIQDAVVIREQNCESKPTCVFWVSKTELVVGLEDGKLMLMSSESNKEPAFHEVHKQRVKAIAYTNDVLATASSSGDVALWDLDFKENKLEKICSINIGCRPTCIALIDLSQFDDDYILKKEDKPQEKVIVKKSSNIKDQPLHKGTVVVEYEDEDQSEIVAVAGEKIKLSENCEAVCKIDGTTRSEELRSSAESWTETPLPVIAARNKTKSVKKRKSHQIHTCDHGKRERWMTKIKKPEDKC